MTNSSSQLPNNAPAATCSRPTSADGRSLTGLVIASVGLVGWLLVMGIVFSTHKEAYGDDGQRNVLAGMHNFFAYLFQVAVGLVGLGVNGTLSLVGTLVSATAVGTPSQKVAWAGVGVGAAGLLIGAAVVLWRLTAWGIWQG